MQEENKLTRNFIIGTFVTLYVMVSIISTIHVIDFFNLSNPSWLAITLAIAFEIGAAASLASIIALQKMNRGIVWALFFILTAMQAMGNAYYAYVHLENYQAWVELFGLIEEEPITQKRILSIVSGAILPLVALGFIKSLVDYIKPTHAIEQPQITDSVTVNDQITDAVTQSGNKIETKEVFERISELEKEGKLPIIDDVDVNDEEPTALANSEYRDSDTYTETVAEEPVVEEPVVEESDEKKNLS